MIKGYNQELNLVKSIQLINNFGAKIRWLFDQNIKPLKFLQNETLKNLDSCIFYSLN